jgi:glycosyltransferase involved in cell wall biosynthesis
MPMPSPDHKISIIIPCYNEGDIIDRTIDAILSIINNLAFRFELIFVDDGSEDQTLDRILSAKKRMQAVDVVVLELSRNFGKEAAMTAGLDAATGDACIFLDADLQDPPELIPELISRWKAGYDVVAIRRSVRTSDSLPKRTTAALFYKLNNLVAERPMPENVGDSRLIDRSVVLALRQLPENRRFMKGLFSWVGFRTAFVDTSRVARATGGSKFSPLHLINFALEGFTSFSTSLLRLWTIFGIVISLYAFGHGTFILVRTMIHGVVVPGYASLMVVILFLGGVQMVGFGLLGEYVGRIYHEAKRRPVYILRRRYTFAGHD